MRGSSADRWQLLLAGAAAGAAGTTALNAVTYLDMAVRGRPASSTPEATVQKISDLTHLPVPGNDDTRQARLQGLGPLSGLLTGVGTGALLGLARAAGWRPGLTAGAAAATVGALLGSNGPMTALGVTDPRSWAVGDWVADVVPHLAYGLVTDATLRALHR